ncbi:MAG: GNAT family N-acetyltransferase [Porphyromonadaceae bacterium]|nr:GNAT family N-acetyltransferase [Porphyromonadaceae bacterium]
MITQIRPATYADLPDLMAVYAIAREFMCRSGNASQWAGGYPAESFIIEEIASEHSFVCENEAKEIAGTFCLICGEDPTYAQIYDGEWLNHEPYATVHRIASRGKEKGVAKSCIEWCFTRYPNIRIDTHRDNLVMQHIIQSMGFTYCGIVFVSDGTERLAYQKTV